MSYKSADKPKADKPKVFVFDYDDTLAWNQCYYTRAKARMANYIIEKFFPQCPESPEVMTEFKKRDIENTKKYGLSTKRFPTSWLETYEHLCHEYKRTPSKWEEYRIKRMANSFLKVKKGLVEGAEETLDYLASNGDRLVLVTKGDQKLQQKKIAKNRLKRWFVENDDLKIVDIDKTDAFRKIMEEAEAEYGKDGFKAYSVGNSYKSDIMPAIEAGMKGILIPFETWTLDEEKKTEEEQKHQNIESGKLMVLDSLPKLVEHYTEL